MAKKIVIDVFTYDELPTEEAKKTAIAWWKDAPADYVFSEEYRKSLDAFCRVFPLSVTHWEVDSYNFSYRISIEDSNGNDLQELSGQRLRTFIVNNYWDSLYEGKTYGEYKKRSNGQWRYDRVSKVMFKENDCPFTGMCADEDLLDPIRAFVKVPNGSTMKQLMDSCVHSFFKAWRDEMSYQNSDEYIAETLTANEYEFDQYGNRFIAPYDRSAKKKKVA